MGDSETRAIKRRNAKATGRAAVAFQRFIRRLIDETDGGALGLERSTGIAHANFQSWKDKPKPTLPGGGNLVILRERLGDPIESFLGLAEKATQRRKGASAPQATQDSLAVALAKHVYERFLIRHRSHQPNADGILHVLGLRSAHRKLGWKPQYRADGTLIPDYSEAGGFLKRITNEAIDEADALEQFAAPRRREALSISIRELMPRLTVLGTDATSVLLTEVAATQLLLSAAVSLDEAVMREAIRRVKEALKSAESPAIVLSETAEERERALVHENDPITDDERENERIAKDEVAALDGSIIRVKALEALKEREARLSDKVARFDAFVRDVDKQDRLAKRLAKSDKEKRELRKKQEEALALVAYERARIAAKVPPLSKP